MVMLYLILFVVLAISSFNSNGFGVGADTTYLVVNSSGNTFVGWQWQAGKGSTSSNTNGSITSTVSASTTAGFSIVTYTGRSTAGQTVGHGLNNAPSLIIIKSRTDTSYWFVYHSSLGNTQYVLLKTNDAANTDSTAWNNTSPSSTVFTLGNNANLNSSANNHVAYCWAQIPGFSAFGSYTGNGSATGPFIYTGFQPKFILIKVTSTTGDWYIFDSSRSGYNSASNTLFADTYSVETSATSLNILSNGFQIASATFINTSSATYIYATFAANPFKYSNAF
jgi:hypothetical protein